MQKVIHTAINEYTGQSFTSFDAVLKSYSPREILDMYLNYEGIIGYTNKLLSVMTILGFAVDVEDADFVVEGDEDIGFFGPESNGPDNEPMPEPSEFVNLPPDQIKNPINKKVFELGHALEKDCPQNDCRLFLNIFGMACDLDEQVGQLHGWTRNVVERELAKLYFELGTMYMTNYAIRMYRKERQL